MSPFARAVSAAAVLAWAVACDNEPSRDLTPPVLSQPVIDLAHAVAFIPFGAMLNSGVTNPTYEIRTDVDTIDVVAAGPGVVVAIRLNDQGDDEVEIRPTKTSVYAVIYDHVRERRVEVGSSVQAGTVLGRIGWWWGTEGRVELQVNKYGDVSHGEARELALCPRQFGTAAFNDAHDAALAGTGSTSSVCVAETVVP